MRPPDRGCAAERRCFVIIKKDINPDEFNALVNFINGPEAILGKEDTDDRMIDIGRATISQRRVIRFKGNIGVNPDGDEFSVTVEIDERVGLREVGKDSPTYMPLPGRFLTNLLKALGSPLE